MGNELTHSQPIGFGPSAPKRCEIDPGSLRCVKCGAIVSGPHVRRNCGAERVGLGDYLAAGLSAVGITKQRVQALASRVGIKDCGCGKRQKAANELGRKYLGIGGPKPP